MMNLLGKCATWFEYECVFVIVHVDASECDGFSSNAMMRNRNKEKEEKHGNE